MPIYIFIDKNVYAEYHTYSKNKKVVKALLSDPDSDFKFAYVDNSNIFDFIDEIKMKAIATFEKFDEIENYLTNQWAGMFYSNLVDIMGHKDKKEVLDSVSELQNITDRMNEMIDQIGKTVLMDSGKYDDVVRIQNEKTIKHYVNKIFERIKFTDFIYHLSPTEEKSKIFEIAELFNDVILKYPNAYDVDGDFDILEFLMDSKGEEIIKAFNNQLKKINLEFSIEIKELTDIYEIYGKKLKPLLNTATSDAFFKEAIENQIESKFKLPF